MLFCKPQGLSHMKLRGSPAATVLTKGTTLPEGSADLEISHQANRRGILPSERVGIFSVRKMNLKKEKISVVKNCI